MRTLIAIAMVLAGIAGGLGLGIALRAAPGAPTLYSTSPSATSAGASGGAADHSGAGVAEDESAGAAHPRTERSAGARGDGGGGHDAVDGGAPAGAERNYVKLGRQIIVPVVVGGQTRALMLFDLALDVPREMTELAYAAEPRLRDAFLRELFELSHTGAFLADYTGERVVVETREKLSAAARRILGDAVAEVLILDIVRQEL